jgi:arginine repressor
MVWLLTCNGKSACAGRLIDGGNTMLFLGMINGSNTTLLLASADGLINGGDTALLLSAG